MPHLPLAFNQPMPHLGNTMKSIAGTLDDLMREEATLVAEIEAMGKRSGQLRLAAARGDAASKQKRTDLLAALQTAQHDLADVRAAIESAVPLQKIETLRERVV